MRALFPDIQATLDTTREDHTTHPTTHRVELPHPIPYQGSKRLLAPRILSYVAGRRFRRLYEPFAGSAALTIAAAHMHLAGDYVIGDSLAPLAALWQHILSDPATLADTYELLWVVREGESNSIDHYYRIRDAFNQDQDPAHLLYLLARCVKNSPRFNRMGQFNQSPDKRRHGMRPRKMRYQIFGAHALLHDRAHVVSGDFERTVAGATGDDLIYLDPPYEGTSTGTDRRYYESMDRARLVHALEEFDRRGVPYVLSYDGQSGAKRYGDYLPEYLNVERIDLAAGRSSQATLNGRNDTTIESLYVSRSLLDRPEAIQARHAV